MPAQTTIAPSLVPSSTMGDFNIANGHQFPPVGVSSCAKPGPIIVSDSEEELGNRALDPGDHMYRGKSQPCVLSDENAFSLSRPRTRGASKSARLLPPGTNSTKRSRSSTSVIYDDHESSQVTKKQRTRNEPVESVFVDTEATVEGDNASSDESDPDESDDDFMQVDDAPLGEDPPDLYVLKPPASTGVILPVTPVGVAHSSGTVDHPTALGSPLALGDVHMNVKAIHSALTNQNNPYLNDILRTVGHDPYLLSRLSAMFPTSPPSSTVSPSPESSLAPLLPTLTLPPVPSTPATPTVNPTVTSAPPAPLAMPLPSTPLPSSFSPSYSNTSTPQASQPAAIPKPTRGRPKGSSKAKGKVKVNAKAKGKAKAKDPLENCGPVAPVLADPPSQQVVPSNSLQDQPKSQSLPAPPLTQTPGSAAELWAASLSPAQILLLQQSLVTPPQTPQRAIAPSVSQVHIDQTASPTLAVQMGSNVAPPSTPLTTTSFGPLPSTPFTGTFKTMKDLAALLPEGSLSAADGPFSNSTGDSVTLCVDLPLKCEVNDEALQDPLLAASYAGLPPLRKGRFTSWSSKVGRGQCKFTYWCTKLPHMSASVAYDFVTHVQDGRIINLSRCSPLIVNLREVRNNGALRYNVYVGSTPAIAMSCGYLWDSHVTLPKPYGLSQKMLSVVLHKQEWERLVGWCCMVFNQKTIAAQVNFSALQFSTRADWNPDTAANEGLNPVPNDDDDMFSHTPSPALDTASSYTAESMSISANATVPVYDVRNVAFNVKTDLHKIAKLPLWSGEIPRGSFVVSGYTVGAYCSSQKWNLATNIQWAIVVAVPKEDPAT